MKPCRFSSLAAAALTVMVIGSFAVATVSLTASPAFSKSNNTNSNPNSGRENNNRGGNGSRRSDNDSSRDAAPISAGAVNAAHTNETVLANALENTNDGMITIYRTAVGITANAKLTLQNFIAECGENGSRLAESVTAEYGGESSVLFCDQVLTNASFAEGGQSFTAKSYIEFLETKLTAARDFEDTALLAAANRVTDDQIIEALWDILEIEFRDLPDPTE